LAVLFFCAIFSLQIQAVARKWHGKDYDNLGDMVLRYDKKSDGAFAVKPTESAKKLVELGDDCFYLVERFKDHEAITRMDSYKHLVRIFSEQCIVEKDENNTSKVAIKASKDISSDSLQNPSDPDAGYCGHKGNCVFRSNPAGIPL
jgi:hypothetical protein